MLKNSKNNKNFSFEIEKKMDGKLGRVGKITTPNGSINTPAFVVVGTKANVKGITPEMLILSGRCDDWPPYTFLPTTRLAYWIGILRWAVSKNTIMATTPNIISSMIGTKIIGISPDLMS